MSHALIPCIYPGGLHDAGALFAGSTADPIRLVSRSNRGGFGSRQRPLDDDQTDAGWVARLVVERSGLTGSVRDVSR